MEKYITKPQEIKKGKEIGAYTVTFNKRFKNHIKRKRPSIAINRKRKRLIKKVAK